MLAFTVTEHGISPLIKVTSEPYPNVSVGRNTDYGRAILIPVGIKDFGRDVEVITNATPYTNSKGTRMIVRNRGCQTNDALVLATIRSGVNGRTEWSGCKLGPNPCSSRGKHINGLLCPNCATALPAALNSSINPADKAHNIHPDQGVVQSFEPLQTAPGLSVFARATVTERSKGKTWKYLSCLLVMSPGATFRVYRSGSVPASELNPIYVHWNGTNIELAESEPLVVSGAKCADSVAVN